MIAILVPGTVRQVEMHHSFADRTPLPARTLRLAHRRRRLSA